MTDLLTNVCATNTPKIDYFIQTMRKDVKLYNNTYELYCNGAPQATKTARKTTFLSLNGNEGFQGTTLPRYDPKRDLKLSPMRSVLDLSDDESYVRECGAIQQYKCESRSLYRTCGYSAANPKSNLHAFCNEMRVYLVSCVFLFLILN